MALREIVKEGYESLSKVCKPVTAFDSKLKTLVRDMIDTLIDADGLGLAAPQIGVLRRLAIVIDDNGDFITLINPVITKRSGEQYANEGCLSVPGVFGKTKRPAEVTVEAYDVDGNKFSMTRTGITAVCICHETDHLDGKLFREHVIEYLQEDDE